METTTVNYAGAELDVPLFIANDWPFDLPLTAWPSFCGAGKGFGDWVVPDVVCGVLSSCVCYEHDCSWAVAPVNFPGFLAANVRFYKNLRSLVLANYDPDPEPHDVNWSLRPIGLATPGRIVQNLWLSARNVGRKLGRTRVETKCGLYFFAVQCFGWKHFVDRAPDTESPFDNLTVIDRKTTLKNAVISWQKKEQKPQIK
jgi:hypothetical protein